MTWFKQLTEREPLKGLLFGLEIEIEGSGLEEHASKMPRPNWIVESDGSLRGGLEFKLRQPETYESCLSRVQEYGDFLSSADANATPRTSVHIHVNVQHLSDEQLKSFVWLSVAMEPVIMKFCTELRNHNGYCAAVHKTTNLVSQWRGLLSSLGNRSQLHTAVRRFSKYAATGGFRLKDLGTIEFRMFPGCTYAPKLIWYMDIIRAIYDTAVQYTVQQLQDRKISDGVLSLISDVIISNRKRVTLAELNECIEVGIRMANDTVRNPMTWDNIKALHKSLFPSQFKAWDSNSMREIIEAEDRKAALKAYDPEDIQGVISDQYSLFQAIQATGKSMGESFLIAEEICKELGL